MSELSQSALDALAPLRAYVATNAQNSAATAHDAAQTKSDALLAEAESERERIIAEAVDDGKRSASAAAALTSARLRRQANEVVLAQREAIRKTLRAAVMTSATAVRDEPRYSVIRDHLAARGRALLGQEASMIDVPEGGILVETPSRRLDLSLPTLASETFDEMTAEVSSLWTR